MAFAVKDWIDYPSTSTPLNAVALEDLETRLSNYTDAQIATRAPIAGGTFTGNVTIGPAAGNAFLTLAPSAAAQQAAINFNQGATNKWQVGKQSDDSFFIWDAAGGVNFLASATGAGSTAVFTRAQLTVDPGVGANNATLNLTARVVTTNAAVNGSVSVGTGNTLSLNTPGSFFFNAPTGGALSFTVNGSSVASFDSAGRLTASVTAKTGSHPVHGTGWAYWGHASTADASGGYAVLQNAAGTDTRLNTSAGGVIGFFVNNGQVASINGAGLLMANGVQSRSNNGVSIWNADNTNAGAILNSGTTNNNAVYINASLGIGAGPNVNDALHITSATAARVRLTKTGTLAGTSDIYDDGALNINSDTRGIYMNLGGPGGVNILGNNSGTTRNLILGGATTQLSFFNATGATKRTGYGAGGATGAYSALGTGSTLNDVIAAVTKLIADFRDGYGLIGA